jgi:large subunit ribosomal protein L3
MSGLIGRKIGMTSIFDENEEYSLYSNRSWMCCYQVRTKGVDSGFDDKNEKHSTKAALGHFKKSGTVAKKKSLNSRIATEQNRDDMFLCLLKENL